MNFNKHMRLGIGREQLDKTDSNIYFVKNDSGDWKIADIQAYTNKH